MKDILPHLKLRPHELLPGVEEELSAPAHARIVYGGREVLLRSVKVGKMRYVVFVRDLEGNCLLRHCNGEVVVWNHRPVNRKLERIGRYLRQKNGMFRCEPLFVVRDREEIVRVAVVGERYASGNPPFSYSALWLRDDLSSGWSFSFKDNGKGILDSLTANIQNPFSHSHKMWKFTSMTPEKYASYCEETREYPEQQDLKRLIEQLSNWWKMFFRK